jgi:hypothetical protein
LNYLKPLKEFNYLATEKQRWALAIVVGIMLLAEALWTGYATLHTLPLPSHLILIVPDGLPDNEIHVRAWMDAAAELGFAMRVVHARELLQPGSQERDAALIVPDTVHRRMNDTLVAYLRDRVHSGGLLMLVHDAGVQGPDGRPSPRRSRLSSLAGVDYALYDQLGIDAVRDQVVQVDAAALSLLQLPSDRLRHQKDNPPLGSERSVARADEKLVIAGDPYGRLRYSVFATSGSFDGQRLMYASDGVLVAGLHRVAAGTVLFVNLPLGELKLGGDGLLLDAFLRVFAQAVARLSP